MLIDSMKTIHDYMCQVDIIKQINKRIIITFKTIHYNDNICEYGQYLL